MNVVPDVLVELPYGADTLSARVDWADCLGILDVAPIPACASVEDALRDGLSHPIGQPAGMMEGIHAGDTVTISVSDAFRKTGVHLLLPALLDELGRRGVSDEDITFLFATGSHRPPRPDERAVILGEEVYRRFESQSFVHDPHDDANLKLLGTTRRGTPVRINRRAVECDRLIVTGAVVLHYFGGFGGGRKGLVPGLAGIDTIAHNHAMNLDPHDDRLNPNVRIGVMEGNPVAEDMMEAARMVPVHALINTLLNGEGEIARVFVGDLEEAHRQAARAAYEAFAVGIDRPADFVIAASAATKNFVQTHKALFNAFQAIRPVGRIILAAPCPEGLGGERFVKWLKLGTPEAIIAGLRERAEINGQTALSTRQKAPLTDLVTEMGEDEVSALGAVKAASLDDALDHVRRDLAASGIARPVFYVMPHAAYTVPVAR